MNEEGKNIPDRNNSQGSNAFRELNSLHFTGEVHFASAFQAAIYWTSKGYNVLPVKRLGNIPATPHGLKDATSELNIIRGWFSQDKINCVPSVNIATVPPEGSSLFDVDIDMHGNNGMQTWRKITQGKTVPRTLTELTQSGGLHLSFLAEEPVKSRVGLFEGIDIIGQKHYAIRAPSVREKGAYHVFDWEIVHAPSWLLDMLETENDEKSIANKAPVQYSGSGSVDSEKIVHVLEPYWAKADGRRNDFTLAIAGFIARSGGSENDATYIITKLCDLTGKGCDHVSGARYAFHREGNIRGFRTLAQLMEDIENDRKQC